MFPPELVQKIAVWLDDFRDFSNLGVASGVARQPCVQGMRLRNKHGMTLLHHLNFLHKTDPKMDQLVGFVCRTYKRITAASVTSDHQQLPHWVIKYLLVHGAWPESPKLGTDWFTRAVVEGAYDTAGLLLECGLVDADLLNWDAVSGWMVMSDGWLPDFEAAMPPRFFHFGLPWDLDHLLDMVIRQNVWAQHGPGVYTTIVNLLEAGADPNKLPNLDDVEVGSTLFTLLLQYGLDPNEYWWWNWMWMQRLGSDMTWVAPGVNVLNMLETAILFQRYPLDVDIARVFLLKLRESGRQDAAELLRIHLRSRGLGDLYLDHYWCRNVYQHCWKRLVCLQ
ncbi:hypothetical protein HK102_006340 [Quaeritorhiza haematococci]|nr:hypothetical protein HK102_006340 [Quaeritorhiza haematococci]